MFSKLFFETTAPESEYSRLLSLDVLFSILFHSVLYILFFHLVGYIFNIKFSKETCMKLFIAFIVIMVVGYPARLMRVKCLRNTLMGYGFDEKTARHIAVSMMNNGYFTWFFMG